jgi:glycosyltransferase involved in cell wall biosynthesis
MLKERLPVRLVLVGEPDSGNPSSIDPETVYGWVEEGVVEWWGWQANMKAVYARSHIVALPSMHEGVPTVLLEAAASGRPLVASDIPGCRAVIHHGENGLLVPVNDPAALADALETLARRPQLRERMGKAGRRLVEDHFTDEHVNQATLAVYQKAARRTGRVNL